ncbi:MAG TPA: plasmid replication protein, CyRepA1 family, partial [Coleofasciculaceae cyanobacterium]
GRIGKKDFDERLHPDLVPLAQPGREFQILFDHETQLKTRWAVYQATVRTGKAIEAVGCVCSVGVLPGPEKGVDDFVVGRGEQANSLLTAIVADAYTLKDYQCFYRPRVRGLSDKYKPQVRVNVKYLSQAISLPSRGLIVLSSDMGTGKTELLRQWRSAHPQVKFLNNGHRVNLLKNLAQRLDTEMYSAVSQGDLVKANALSITIDSLHKLRTDALTYGCVFIDEACQYLTHLLHSKTCKEHRAEILEVLEYLVFNAPLVVIADAHIDDVTVDFFRAMRPKGEEPFIIKNSWNNGGRTVYWYEGKDSSALVAQISAALMSGQKIMVVSDSKRFIKKLEASLSIPLQVEESGEGSIAQLKVWSVHSENSGSKENVAFIKDITNAVKNLDALLASPSLGTGVDIPDYHFDAVFGAFHAASQTATECAQQLYRYRQIVPIHVWVAPRPPFGYKNCNPTLIKEHILQTNEITAFLIRIDKNTGRRGAEKDWALDAYCQIEAARHQSINNLRSDLRSLLAEMGKEIIPTGEQTDVSARTRLKAAAEALAVAHNRAVVKAKDITASEYRARGSKDYLTPEEVFECEKFRLRDAYGCEVTEELVALDDGGQLQSRLVQLEAILAAPDGTIADPQTGRIYPAPPQWVAQRDRGERERLPICTDWGNYSAQWLARFNLGLHDIVQRLIAGEEFRATDPTLEKMRALALQCAVHIKAILGFCVPPDCSPMWLLALLVEQLGLKLVSRKQGPRGKQERIYFLAAAERDFALKVLAHREAKRVEKEKREQEFQEQQRRYQAAMQFRYGVAPPSPPVSTPPEKRCTQPFSEGVDTEANPQAADAFLLAEVALHKDGGEEAVAAVMEMWDTQRRCSAFGQLELMGKALLIAVLEAVPQIVTWLDESKLPRRLPLDSELITG